MLKNLIANVLGFGLVTTLLLSGCASTATRPIVVSSKPVPQPKLVLPKADTLQLKPIEWTVITETNIGDKITKFKKDGDAFVIFGLTEKGYKDVSLNFADISAYLQQQQVIIKAYENYYVNSANAINEANKNIEESNAAIEKSNKEQETKANEGFFNRMFK